MVQIFIVVAVLFALVVFSTFEATLAQSRRSILFSNVSQNYETVPCQYSFYNFFVNCKIILHGMFVYCMHISVNIKPCKHNNFQIKVWTKFKFVYIELSENMNPRL